MRQGGSAGQPLGRMSIVMMGGLMVVLSTMLTLWPDFMSAAGLLKRAQWLLQLSAVCVALLITLGVPTATRPQEFRSSGRAGDAAGAVSAGDPVGRHDLVRCAAALAC